MTVKYSERRYLSECLERPSCFLILFLTKYTHHLTHDGLRNVYKSCQPDRAARALNSDQHF